MKLGARRERVALLALVALGGGLRLWQYLGRDTLYLDELALLRNVLGRTWLELVRRPLDYDQLAPPAFLLTEKLATAVAGRGEYAVRFFPFVCSVAAIGVLAPLARRLLSWPAAMAAVAMFATAGPLIYFGAQIKQYSTDVLCACVLLLLGTRYLSGRDPRAAWHLGIAAAVFVWFSQPSVFVLAGILLVLALEETRRRRREGGGYDRPLAASLGLATLSAVASIVVAKHRLTASGVEFMNRYWADGFAPGGVVEWLRRPWPFAQLLDLFGTAQSNSMGYAAPFLFVAAALAGTVLLARRGPVGQLVVAPVVVTLAASAAGQYPFSARLVYFLLPSLFLSTAAVAERVAVALGKSPVTRALPLGVAALACVPVLTTLPTYHRDHLRPAVQYVASNLRLRDEVYVYYGAAAFWYEAPARDLADTGLVAGRCHRGDPRQYLRELDELRGASRAFVLFNHADPGELDDMLRYLDTIGTRLVEFESPGHWYFPRSDEARVLLYDLSDGVLLRAARSGTFPLRPFDADPLVPCDHGPVSMPSERMTP